MNTKTSYSNIWLATLLAYGTCCLDKDDVAFSTGSFFFDIFLFCSMQLSHKLILISRLIRILLIPATQIMALEMKIRLNFCH